MTGIENDLADVQNTISHLTSKLDSRQNKSQDDRNKMAESIESLAMRQAVMENGLSHMQLDIARGAKASEEMSKDLKDMLARMQRDQIEGASRTEQFRQIRGDIYGPPHPGVMQRLDAIESARSREIGIVIGGMFVAGLLGGLLQAWAIHVLHF